MHVLLFFAIFAASFAFPLPFRPSSQPSVSTFYTGYKPAHAMHYRRIRPMPFGHHRYIRRLRRGLNPAYNEVFWAFGHRKTSSSDLPPVQDALKSMIIDGASTGTSLAPQATVTTDGGPLLHEIPRLPAKPTLTVPTVSSSSTSDTHTKTSENPSDAHTMMGHKHTFILIVVFVSCVTGCGLMIWISTLLAKFGMCNWRRKKRTFAEEGTGEEKDTTWGEARKLHWFKWSGKQADFRVGFIGMGGGETRRRQTTAGRNYDEKGIEQGPPYKRVSFEEVVVDIGHELPFELSLDNADPSGDQVSIPGIHKPQPRELQADELPTLGYIATSRLSPEPFCDNEGHNNLVYASHSHISNISMAHSRTKSAPNVRFKQRDSDTGLVSDKSSAASSEWDIARTYGGPRYDRAKSVGAMSGLSVDSREWDEGMRMSGSRSGNIVGRD